MITLRINIVALIVAGIVWFMFYTWLSETFTALEMAMVAIPVLSTKYAYDFIANLSAFKKKGKAEQKNEGKK